MVAAGSRSRDSETSPSQEAATIEAEIQTNIGITNVSQDKVSSQSKKFSSKKQEEESKKALKIKEDYHQEHVDIHLQHRKAVDSQPYHKEERSKADHHCDSSLDFFSPDFDPLKALHAKNLAPPNPRVRPLDNLSSCRKILPEEIPESIINAPAKAPRSAESIQAQERAKAHKSVLLRKVAERERQTKIFDKIVEKLKDGPLGLLAECYHHKLRVKVWTRHARGVRGTLTGFLVAFDKHINLVLCDIVEEYSVRRWIPRLVRRRGRSARNLTDDTDVDACCQHPVMESSNRCTSAGPENQNDLESLTTQLHEMRIFPKLEHRRRQLKQVFLRGESVVIIQKLP